MPEFRISWAKERKTKSQIDLQVGHRRPSKGRKARKCLLKCDLDKSTVATHWKNPLSELPGHRPVDPRQVWSGRTSCISRILGICAIVPHQGMSSSWRYHRGSSSLNSAMWLIAKCQETRLMSRCQRYLIGPKG